MQTTKNYKKAFRSVLAAGLMGLSGLVQSTYADTNKVAEVKTSGNVAYYMGKDSKTSAPTSYAEVNHSTSLPYGTKISGFVDMYQDSAGYFGKTIVEKSIGNGFSARAHVMHINTPLSQAGIGASYVLPTPKYVFAKVSYLPAWVDNKGEQVDNKQIVGIFACGDLTSKVSLSGFAEVNMAGKKGPQFGYGEIELARKFGERVSVGANLQLNGKGAGVMTPEFVPRVALRVNF
jgi:hypothetical protein